jgi:CubicO group peptidase (beta-lactamase class C family)
MRKAKSKVITIWLTLLLTMGMVFGQSITLDKTRRIERYVESFYDQGLFTGTVLVTSGLSGRRIVYEGAFGMANKEWGVKNKIDTRLLIGSNTKQFTAMLVMQEVARGNISLDGTISDYLPWYRTDTGSQVTIHELLSMQSRVPNYTTLSDFTDLPGYSDENDPPQWGNTGFLLYFPTFTFIQKYCSRDLAGNTTQGCENSPYEYSSSNYYILGSILETVTGKTFATLLRERIFEPLQMEDSGYYFDTAIIPKTATGYLFDTSTGYLTKGRLTDMSTAFSAGAIYSTADDLNLWNAALYTDQLLSSEYRYKLFTPYVPMCPNIGDIIGIQIYYGYGFMIGYLPVGPGQQLTMIAHGGTVADTFESFMIRIIEDKYTIIVLSNTAVVLPSGYPPVPTGMGLGIFQILYGMNPSGASSPSYYYDHN